MKNFIKVLSMAIVLSFVFNFNVCAISNNSVIETDTFVSYEFDSNVGIRTNVSTTVFNNPINSALPDVQESNLVAPCTVIGSDGRTMVTNYSQQPYSAICFIVTYWPNGGRTVGTGWLFNEDSIMTAAHCVYNPTYGGVATSMKVYPAKNGANEPYGEIRADSFVINSNWEESQSISYDYALVKLDEAVGNECGYFGYTYDGGTIGDNITVTGYPGDKFGANYTEIYQWTMSGRLNAITTHRLAYTIDTYGGQSGSPVYLTNSNVAIGIHTQGELLSNSATRITYNMYQMMIAY